jgi:hypothetical protein
MQLCDLRSLVVTLERENLLEILEHSSLLVFNVPELQEHPAPTTVHAKSDISFVLPLLE